MVSRRPPLAALTGARYFAALAVVFFHYGRASHLPWAFFSLGRQAVSFFFVLSGLVLTYSYSDAIASRQVAWGRFMNLRLARILPMHIVSLLIATAIYWHSEPKEHAVSSWLSSLLCVQVYWPSATNALHWNAPSWSISCELFFYALFPLLSTVITRSAKTLRSLLFVIVAIYILEAGVYLAAASLIDVQLKTNGRVLGFVLLSKALTNALPLVPVIRLGEFCIGICLGLFVIRHKARLASRLTRELLLASGLAGVYLLLRVPWDRFGAILSSTQNFLAFVPFFALAIVAIASGRTLLSAVLENPAVVFLGHASYSLYLLHYPLGAVLLKGRTPLRYAMAVAAVTALSAVSFRLIELPTLKAWRSRLRSPQPSECAVTLHGRQGCKQRRA